MKKIGAIVFAVIIMVSLSACGSIKQNVVNQLKSAANAVISALPDVTEEVAVSPVSTDETTEPVETAVSDTEQPEASATPDARGEKGIWPEGVPSYVPVFQYGAYVKEEATKMEAGTGVTYGMHFTGVTKEDMEAYNKTLKDAKFEVIAGEADGTYSIVGGLKKDDTPIASIIVTWSSGTQSCDYVLIVTA